uniref:Mitochondrial folate transporter/carrier n=1 Tax=Anguilla anguilla TaxID=7936 RepID=A0A0E9RQF2_ANGAN
MKSVWQLEGVRGLYQGVTPNMWGAGASWGLYFFLLQCNQVIHPGNSSG